MSARHGILGVAIVAAVIVVLSFAGIGSDLTTGIFWNIDGLLLLSVCLLMVLVFGAMLFFVFKKPKEEQSAPGASKPAATAAPRPAAPAAAPLQKSATPASAVNPSHASQEK